MSEPLPHPRTESCRNTNTLVQVRMVNNPCSFFRNKYYVRLAPLFFVLPYVGSLFLLRLSHCCFIYK